ncbi:MAG: AAA domain-containing protein [Gammaproteobacteria bacterium]|nr:AAA domain-containing protein [Gammaproteobacteria bacterium]
MNNFLSMLFEETEAFSQLYQNFSSIGSNASSWRDSKKTENSSNNFVDELEKIINLIQKNAFYLESFMLQRSQIVFATLISSGRKWLRKQIDSFSMVLLDEAAQALVPETLIPLYFNPSLYIQIGDPNQLPATITSQAARNKGYEHSMMHWLIREFSQPHEMLTIQYRMDQEICHWISRQYYENRLITAPEVIQRKSVLQENRFLPALFKNSSLFFNVNGEENRRGGSDLTASCFNLIEARKVIDMAYYLIMSCGIQPTQIGIITFYAEQVNILIENLQKVMRDKNKFHDLEIKTVDGFQGGEKDIILVSAVRTSESVGFLNDWRRLNVGMSRAKYGRWIFGKFDSLIRSNSDFSSLLSEHVERVTVVSQEQLSAHVPNNDYTQRRGHVKFP